MTKDQFLSITPARSDPHGLQQGKLEHRQGWGGRRREGPRPPLLSIRLKFLCISDFPFQHQPNSLGVASASESSPTPTPGGVPPPIFKILGDDFGSYPIKLSDQPRGQERSVSVLASCVTEGGSPCLSVPAFSPWEPEVRIFPHCQVLRDLGE